MALINEYGMYDPTMPYQEPAPAPGGGSGSPEGVVIGSPFDEYWDIDADTKYIKETGVGTKTGWVAAGGGGAGVTDGDKGDITVSGSGANWEINNEIITSDHIQDGSVNLTKLQDIGGPTILGKASAGSGPPEALDQNEITAVALAYPATLSSDDTYSGETITGLDAGATIAQWEAVYLNSSSQWVLADSNGTNTYPVRGLAVAAGTSGNDLTVITHGVVRNDAWNWTPGGNIYLSETAGALTQTAPSTSGSKVQIVGYALSADVMFVNISPDYGTAP